MLTSSFWINLDQLKEKVRRQIASMIDGRPDIVVYADRPLTSNEYELIRENAEEFEEAYPMDEPLHIHLEGEDISDAIADLSAYIQ